MSASKVKKLTALREISIRQLASLKEVADRVAGKGASYETLLPELKARYLFIERTYSDFYTSHNELIAILAAADEDEEEIKEHEQIRDAFDRDYYDIQVKYNEAFTTPPKPRRSDSPETPVAKEHVKLPPMELYKFNGDLKTWKTFIDMYNSTIHTQTALSNVEKFSYLISSLSKEPLAVVSRIPMTEDNYPTAYDALIKRYDNKRVLATSYWQQIENAPCIPDNFTSAQLRSLLSTFDENLAALKNSQFPVDSWDFILFNMLQRRLCSSLITRFELAQSSPSEIPTYKSLNEFLSKTCDAADNAGQDWNKPAGSKLKLPPNKPRTALFVKSDSATCPLCQASHLIYKCPVFLEKLPQDRYDIVKKNKWCINCLGAKHSLRNCNSSTTCRVCNQKHHSLLHFNRQPSTPPRKTTPAVDTAAELRQPSSTIRDNQNINSLTNLVPTGTMVLLSTAVVEVSDIFGFAKEIRVLLDCASQSSFITEKCVARLGLPKSKFPFSITGLGGMSTHSNKIVTCQLHPVGLNNPSFQVEAIVIPKICDDIPTSQLCPSFWSNMSNLKLADQQFHKPRAIDMLLGADIFPLILQSGCIQGQPHEPTAINTVFGWVLMGKVDVVPGHKTVNTFYLKTEETALENSIRKFWEIEEPPSAPCVNPDDLRVEALFTSNYYRESQGRFVVPLPFKDENPIFPGSFSIALKRYFALERKLTRDERLRQQYVDFMRDYLNSGHMQRLTGDSIQPSEGYYLPHHCISKVTNPSSKFRVVFDASCKASNGGSLNDSLSIGPKLQKDIFTILIRFRCHPFVLIADIRQMFRQIWIMPEHRKYQKIIWRFSPSEPLQEYQLNTVTYGLAPSPYLALRVIKELMELEKDAFPLASRVLHNDIYVDDIITGYSTINDGHALRDELINLLARGGFELRKWASNEPTLLEPIPHNFRHSESVKFDQESDNFVKILGLKWDSISDYFTYEITPITNSCTKRSLLSELARIFDPLGFLTPLTFFAKTLIQTLWTLGLNWDDIPPEHISLKWTQFSADLPHLAQLKIPRVIISRSIVSATLHGFCDASEQGYGAVIYLRTVIDAHQIEISIICAKSKVAPLKRISIPRLELCAAVLLSKLIHSTVPLLKDVIPIDGVYAWSDSTVALTWILSSPHRWGTFVSNRVAQIQELLPRTAWYHVNTQDNPADCASRGLTPLSLLAHPLWWAGPQWLRQNHFLADSAKPQTLDIAEIPEARKEERKIALLTESNGHDSVFSLLYKFSSLDKIKRIIATCRRFINNLRNKQRATSALTGADLDEALIVLVKYTQSQAFADEIGNLTILSIKSLPKPFRKLNPFLDPDGIIRVGGRLKHSALPFEVKHPILLPSKHRLTELIVEDMHNRHLHPGAQTLHYLLTQRFWILGAKGMISRIISRCYRCWRLRPKPMQPPMGDLPKYRISQIKAFACVGVDYGGPFNVTLGKARGCKSQKAYICLFVCFATKALHIELASDLSCESFLAALRRFIGRRGRCSYIFSDCGTNFVAASRELNSVMQRAVESERLEWHFNPPSAPHFGGLWEAGIKSVKTHLARVIGNQVLTYEELYTVLVQIEAMLNSRPLCPISTDPNDLSALTPGHFLTLEPVSVLPEGDVTHLQMNRLTRWQLLRRLHQDFWARWHHEYLHTLQQRAKWLNSDRSLNVGDLVVIKNDLVPPTQWKLARVSEIHPGRDGVTRVVSLKTAQGTCKRPVVKVCPLPPLPLVA